MLNKLATTMPYRIDLTPEEWSVIPDNPRQRDTELHLRKAKHLLQPAPPHTQVAMAILPDGSRIKLDGHTRDLGWTQGLFEKPKMLCVTVYPLENIEEVIAAYAWFDASDAAEKGSDVLQGAFNANKLRFESQMLRSGKVGFAIRRTYTMLSREPEHWNSFSGVSAAVSFFSKELIFLDGLLPEPKMFSPGLQMGFLATMKGDPSDAKKFWKSYAEGCGVKMGGTMDGVQALIEISLRPKGRKSPYNTNWELFGKTLSTFLTFQAGDTYATGSSSYVRPLKAVGIKKYLARARKKLGTADGV